MARPRTNKGFFQDGKWLCDCDPRLPANHFQAKKGKPENVGKWFYTCQKPNQSKDRCGFFLWQHDAAPREASALRSNSRTESARATRPPPTPSRRGRTPPPPYNVEATTLESSRKRGRPGHHIDDEDDFGLDQGDTMFENELNQMMTEIETPRKAARTDTSHDTPSRRLMFGQERGTPRLATPQTDGRFDRDPFNTRLAVPGNSLLTPHTGRRLGGEGLAQTPTPSSSPLNTPTRGETPNSRANSDLEKDVMEVLRGNNITLNGEAGDALKRVLKKHANIFEGHRRGRDVLRLELKAKEERLASIEQHNISLQAEIEADRAARQFAQWQAEHDNDDDDDDDDE